MSWSIQANGPNKADAIEAFEQKLTENEHCPIKDEVMEAVTSLTNGMPDERALSISSSGHLNEDGSGNVSVSVG